MSENKNELKQETEEQITTEWKIHFYKYINIFFKDIF